jgi:proline iminopeptidase
MELMVRDMEALRKHLNIETWTVMGHSFGGILASYYATLHPERIDKLILSSSGGLNLDLLSYIGQSINGRLSKQERDSLARWNETIAHGDTSFYARLQRGKALAPAYLYNKKYVPIIAERLTQGNATINSLVFANLTHIGYDCTEKLKSFHPKVLIIQGKQDIIHEKTAHLAQTVFPHARLVLLDSCGHYGWLDKEAEYMTVVGNFLQEKP